MRQFTYILHPKNEVKTIVAENFRDALNRISNLYKCSERRIELIESKPVRFEQTPSKKGYRTFDKGKKHGKR